MKLFLIDGHALIFKMYYAFLGRPMVNTKGVDTSILFGFTKYLVELLERERPTHIAVAFDPPGGTFRNKLYEPYKANRGETPQLVIDALEPLTEIVRAMNIPVLMVPGFEADDVIGSMARKCAAEGMDVYMVTPDKDYGQLVDSHIMQYRPGKAGENEILGPAQICEKWGIDNPAQVVDILAICGDASDNVPGVQGVGPVGASRLLGKYRSVEGIYEHLDELTPRQKELFANAADHISLSKVLVTIKTDIPLEITASEMKNTVGLTPELNTLFNLYEFGSLRKKLSALDSLCGSVAEETASPTGAPVQQISYEKVSPEDLPAAERVAIRLCDAVMFVASGSKVASGPAEKFSGLLQDPSIVKTGASLKTQMNSLHDMGIELAGFLQDVEIMHYLLNPERSHSIGQLCSSYLGISVDGENENRTLSLFEENPQEDFNLEVAALCPLADLLQAELEQKGMTSLYNDIEQPLISVLARMEQAGVNIDLGILNDFTASLRSSMLEKEALVRELAGEPGLNVASPKQIGEVIFDKLKLDPKARKPKTGNWPTDEQTLTELFDRSPIIGAILDYRGLRKLLSTYIEPIPGYVDSRDSRVHTTFNQALTATGRLSSSNPNLQNIPIRTEQGRSIRKAFVPSRTDWVIMSADYSQIELRVMAHLCADEHMTAAFRNGTDVHAATAAKIFHTDIGNITPDQRRAAKTANFGIMYGISAFGLAQRLGCSRSQAKELIDDYFDSFPSIRSFIENTLRQARADGYVQTLFGRRRYLPDLASHNAQIRSFAERNAVNAPIQGSAADIIKLAMTGVDRKLREENLKARMILQVHDELVLELPADEIETVKGILVSQMENVVSLSVPLTVECNYGKDWLEAH